MAKERVLIVDDEVRVLESLGENLCEHYEVHKAAGGAEMRGVLAARDIDVVILDYYLRDAEAADLIPDLLAGTRAPEVIVISGKANTKEAVKCLKRGAFDFLLKPYEIEELLATVENALRKRRLEWERIRLLEHNLDRYRLLGGSRVMTELQERISKFAASEATILVHGESGTGKELVAHQLHFLSPRAGGPIRVINCASIPRDLADSELFGHAKGAFTGAAADRAGRIEEAEGGTVFLDEVGDMLPEVQTKLLRFLETREFSRVGENKVRTADVRLVAATHHDLKSAAAGGRFRKDLYYRLSGFEIPAPPLREHKEDIPELAEHFMLLAAAEHKKEVRELGKKALAALMRYHWPGNVREFKHVIERLVICGSGTVSREDVLICLGEVEGGAEAASSRSLGALIKAFQRDLIFARLTETGGNVDEVAAGLGIHSSTLYRKMAELGIQAK